MQNYNCLRTQAMFYDKKGYKRENLLTYIKYYSYPLATLEDTHIRKISNKFGFLLTYSYLCPHGNKNGFH